MKTIKVSNKLYKDLESAKLLFQVMDERNYTIPQAIKRALEISM